MAPTVQNGGDGADKRPQRPQDRRSDIICRVKYCNTLPDIPFDLKFITYPFQSDRFIQYNPTSLERNFKYDVLTEHDLGVTIDLINRDLYQVEPGTTLDAGDEKLLEEDIHAPQDSVRSKFHAKSVSWLRRSEYISTEQTRFQPQNMEKVEAKVGFNVKKSFVEETLYMDREQQIQAIQKTFEDNKKPITTHYCKPNVVPVEVLPIYPDFSNWKYPCAQVIFDADPSSAGKNLPAQIEEMSQAMIRGVMDESGEQFVAYFLPTEDTLEKRRMDFSKEIIYEDDCEYDYKMTREYNWNVKSKASKGYEENYFFVLRNEGIYYNELETRVRLSKRRQKLGVQSNTKLVVKHRPLNENEHRLQRNREKQLEPPGEDDEEEMEDDEPEEEEIRIETREEPKAAAKDRSRSGSRSSRSHSRESGGSRHSGSARSRSRSGSARSRSGSRKSGSRSRSRSGSKSAESGRSRSNSRSRSRSKGSRKSVSRSRSRSKSGGSAASRSRSRSGSRRSGSHRSRRSEREGTKSRSRSGSAASRKSDDSKKSGSRSPRSVSSRSGSGSRSRSGSGSSRSRSGSRDSGSKSPGSARSHSRSSDSD